MPMIGSYGGSENVILRRFHDEEETDLYTSSLI
jgi:hypothetical protein